MSDHPTVYFLVTHGPGPKWDRSRSRQQQVAWEEHAEAMDALVENGTIVLGGPLDATRALLVVAARDERDVEERLRSDPWKSMGILQVESIARWEILLDSRPHP